MSASEATAKAIASAVVAERRRIIKKLRGYAMDKGNWLSLDARKALRDAATNLSRGQ